MQHPLIDYWPLAIALLILLASAASNYWTQRVPNGLTYSAAIAGWLTATLLAGSLPGSLGVSLACSVAALALSLPAYATSSFPAGCVKAQAAAAAWIGCGLAWLPALAVTAAATLGGMALTALAAWLMAKWPREDGKSRMLDAQMPMAVAATFTVAFALALGWL